MPILTMLNYIVEKSHWETKGIQRDQLQVKHENTLNWTAKCCVTKTSSQ